MSEEINIAEKYLGHAGFLKFIFATHSNACVSCNSQPAGNKQVKL
jgi:hypothetical protein